jgi:coronin-1B/1C/6
MTMIDSLSSDGNIRYYEYANDKFEYLSEYKSADPQRGIAFLPKRGVNLHENEISRAYKTVNDSWIEPISFIVPRRSEVFQEDIYPPTTGLKAAVSSGEWFDGKTGLPPKISLESVYEGKPPVEVKSDYTPREIPVTSPPATKTEAPKPKPEPEPEPIHSPVSRGPPPEMKDNKASISAMANKFADKDDEESSDDDASSFEEVPKPVERPSVTAARQEEKTKGPVAKKEVPKEEPKVASPVKPTPAATASQPTRTTSASTLWSKGDSTPSTNTPTLTTATTATAAATAAAAPTTATAGSAAEGLRSSLTDLKEQNNRILSLLEQQNRALGRQMEQIMFLTEEVERLKSKIGSASAPADGGNAELLEKIRRLELELEEARSS